MKYGLYLAIWVLSLSAINDAVGQNIQLSFSAVQPSCFGYTNGSVTATPTGGTAPYTYLWNTGQTGQTNFSAGAGTYSVTVTAQNGQTASGNTTVGQPMQLVASIAASGSNCTVSKVLTAQAVNGVAPYTYLWSTGATTASINTSASGFYYLTVTDANGCAAVANKYVAPPLAVDVVVTNIPCFSLPNGGAAMAAVSGGTTPYTYSWSNNGTTQQVTGLSQGNIGVTVTDANGCAASDHDIVTQPPPISLNITINSPACGGNNGSATLQAIGGTAPYTYNWIALGISGPTVNNLAPATYYVCVFDANNCQKDFLVTIPAATGLDVNLVLTKAECPGVNTGTATAFVNPPGNYNYAWNIQSGNFPQINGIPANTVVTVTVTDPSSGCMGTATGVIGTHNQVHVAVTDVDVPCLGDSTGSALAIASQGTSPYNYVWTMPGGNLVNGPQLNNLPVGAYAVSVTDQNGCTAVGVADINALSSPHAAFTLNTLECLGDSLRVQFAGQTGSGNDSIVSFHWVIILSNGDTLTFNQQTLQPMVFPVGQTGIVHLSVSAASGCMAVANTPFTMTGSPDVHVTIASPTPTCDNLPVNVNVSGNPNYIYSWSPTNGLTFIPNSLNVIANPDSSTLYILTVVNGLCTDTFHVQIDRHDPLNLNISPGNVIPCEPTSPLTATVTVSGGVPPFTYLWSNTQTTATATVVVAGDYTVTVTDALLCTATASTTITQTPPLVVSAAQVSPVSCFGGSNGSASVTASGGNLVYTYLWSNNTTNALATNLGAGTYTVMVTSSGCTVSASATIMEPAELVVLATDKIDASCGNSDGSIGLTVSGGVQPYTYDWGPGQPVTSSISGLEAGSYCVTVTDANNCTKTICVAINNIGGPSASITQVNVSCFGDATGALDLSVTGGTGPFIFNWGPGLPATEDLGNLVAGTYCVTITDASGCTNSVCATIAQPAAALLLTTTSTGAGCNNSSGSIDLTVTGGTAPYTYNWGPGQPTTEDLTGLSAGVYCVTVTDANDCTASICDTLNNGGGGPNLSVIQVNDFCFGDTTGSIDLSVTGAGPFTYNWGPGLPATQDLSGLAAGTYCVTVTDANGCTNSICVTITEPALALELGAIIYYPECGSPIGSINLTVSGGVSPYTFNWGPGLPTTEDLTGLDAGNYCVTVTDANNCTITLCETLYNSNGPALSTTQINVLCFGDSSASIDLTVTGVGPFTYNWGPGMPTTEDLSGLAAGTYCVTVTDANGCTNSTCATITQPDSALLLTTTHINADCGGANGSIDLTVTGGTAPYTYNWGPGLPTTQDLTGLSAGIFCVTVTDANNCTATICDTITGNGGGGPVISFTQENVLCYGDSTGSIHVDVTGVGPFTFNWGPGLPMTQDLTGLPAGTYCVTVTDVNGGCITTQCITITQPAGPLVLATTTMDAACGSSTGSIDLTVTGGTAPYTYNWGPGQPTTQDISGLAAGTYCVTVTDANNCTATICATINNLGGPTLSITQVNVLCFGDSTGSIDLTVTGVGPFTYNWGPGLPTTEDLSGLAAGTYCVTVTDANGCTNSTCATITQPAEALTLTATTVSAACTSATGSIDLTVTGGTPPYTYNWGPGQPTTEDLTGLVAGIYCVTVTDANNCTATTCITINSIGTGPALSITQVENVLCYGDSTGTIDLTVTGNGPFTYNWGPGLPMTEDLTGLPAGTYCVTVTDANGCTSSICATVTQPAAPLALTTTTVDASCGSSNGSIDLTVTGGTPPYTYNWGPGQPTTEDLTGLVAGIYCVTVTDANNCTATTCATINNMGGPMLSVMQANVSCFGDSTGTIDLTVTGNGPFTYNWGPGLPATEDLTGLSAGTYCVTVTDANGCTNSICATITQPAAALAVSATSLNATCGGSNGSIDLTVTGGTPLYTYNWGPGLPATEDLTGLAPGTYCVTVTDANNCTATVCVTIDNIGSGPSLSLTQVNVLCFGASTGSIDLTVTGVGPFTYNWGPGLPVTEDLTDLAAGTYCVTVTDANGCTSSICATITQPAAALLLTTTSANATCGSSNGSIDLTVSGGTGPYGYVWGPGQPATTEDLANLVPGTYCVTVTDANNCTATTCVTIENIGGPSLSVTDVNVMCFGDSTGSIDLMVTGAEPFTYDWGVGLPTTQDLSGLPAGIYCVTVTDVNGCTNSICDTITEPAAPLMASAMAVNATCGNANGSINLTVSGGVSPYTFNWGPGLPDSEDLSGLSAGIYTVTVSDVNNCTVTQPATIEASSLSVQVDASTPSNPCELYPFAVVIDNLNPTDTLTFNYLSNGLTFTPPNIFNGPAGNYSITVVVTNQDGCMDTLTIPVSVMEAPEIAPSISADLCNGKTVRFINSSDYTGTWNFGDNTTSTLDTVTHVYNSSGSYNVSFEPDSMQCVKPYHRTIMVGDTTIVDALINTNYMNCLLNAVIQFNDSTIHTAPIQSWNWTFSSGTPATSMEQNPLINFNMEGTVTATLVVTDVNGCMDTTTIEAAVDIVNESITPDTSFCSTNPVALNPGSAGIGYEYSWTASPPDPTLDPNNPNPVVTPTQTTTYTLTVVNGTCPVTLSTTITPLPGASVDLGEDTKIDCSNGTPVKLGVVSSSNAIGFVWSNSINFPQPPLGTGDTLLVNPIPGGTYYIMALSGNGCNTIDSVKVSAGAAFNIDAQNQVICVGSTATLNVTSNSTKPLSYEWDPMLDPIANPQVSPTANTSYQVIATNSDGCKDTALVTVDVMEYVSVTAENLGLDTLLSTDTTTLLATGTNGTNISYEWTPSNGLSHPNSAETSAMVDETTTFIVTASAEGRCPDTAQVVVYYRSYSCDDPFIFVPKAFTPNGDNNNDLFIVRGIEITSLHFIVWDRWGEIVYETYDPLATGWDGSYKGKEVTPDAYAWYLDLTCGNGQTYRSKGNVTLLK